MLSKEGNHGSATEESNCESQLELDLDEMGRVSGTSDCGLDFSFRSMMCRVLTGPTDNPVGLLGEDLLTALQADCQSLFGSEDSFWLPAGAHPRCTLERLAADIFAFHTRAVEGLDGSCSGAEWWVQVRGKLGGSIGFHWDKDEDLVDSAGICLHPQISTVTYLSPSGAPTAICDCRSPLEYADVRALHGSEFGTVFVSHPMCRVDGEGRALVKHSSFDGRFLHGCPAELSRAAEVGGTPRCTLLVNVWVGHAPLGLRPLPTRLLRRLSDLAASLPLAAAEPCGTLLEEADPEGGFELRAVFGPTGTEHEVVIHLPGDGGCPSVGAADPTKGVEVRRRGGGALGRVGPAPGETLTGVPTISSGADGPSDGALDLFLRHQILIIRGGAQADGPRNGKRRRPPPMMTMDDLRAVYKAFPEDVAQRWNVENGDAGAVTAEAVLGKKRPGCSKRRRAGAGDGTAKGRGEQTEGGWYASFVLNKSDALDVALARMPFEAPRALSGSRVRHTSNAWFFFGQNPSREPLRGRPEHTDRVSHSGTWHAQQSGAKLWRVRPDENASWPSPAPRCREPLSARVEAGDLLIINTALWYHETSLPQGTGEASFSVARDFHLDLGEAGGSEAEEEDSVDMDNCNDTWATDEIPAGTVVAQGDAVMSFPLSDQPNCVLENGSRGTPSRVVSLRHIRAGESLSLPQNDSSSLHLR